MNIPYTDYGGSGKHLHFLHANGYPTACYEPLLKLLATSYHTFGMSLRPLWKGSVPAEIDDWKPLSDDLLKFLDEQKVELLIGIGHSIGAIVTLRAALKDPSRFKALVLIEPVLFPRYFMLEWNLIRMMGMGYRFHPNIGGALRRRREFDDLEQVYIGYRRRDIFRYITDENLRTFIGGMTEPKVKSNERGSLNGGYKLVYSPEWEARIYFTGIWNDWDLWRDLPLLNIPTLILRGSETDTFWSSTSRLIQKKNPKINFRKVEKSTHLLPLEKPGEVFEITHTFLEEIP